MIIYYYFLPILKKFKKSTIFINKNKNIISNTLKEVLFKI